MWEPPWVSQLGCGRLPSWVAPPAGCVRSILVQHLSPWIKSPRGHERARALGLGACLLEFFLERLHVSVSIGLQTSPSSDLTPPSLRPHPSLSPLLGPRTACGLPGLLLLSTLISIFSD